jgi:hypothetical protein
MRKYKIFLISTLMIGVMVSACSHPSPESLEPMVPIPETPAHTETSESTRAPTLAPTSYSTPTHEPTKTIPPYTPVLGETQLLPAGGFSFKLIKDFLTYMNGTYLVTFDKNEFTFINVYGITNYYMANLGIEDFMENYLSGYQAQDGDFELSDAFPIDVSGVQGETMYVTGTVNGYPIKGQAFIVIPNDYQCLYGFAYSVTTVDNEKWKNDGSKIFSDLLNSIEFIDWQYTNKSACPVSTEIDYGYSEFNPIKIGGGNLTGQKRIYEYLTNLRGPNNEIATFQRVEIFPYDDNTLDVYEITFNGGESITTLLIDEYHYDKLSAPMGFICLEPITLESP